MGFEPGLVTVTFRQLSPREIVDLSRETGLTALEWGGDVHVPAGEVGRAREVAAMTRDAGLRTVAYGSYFRVGEDDVAAFGPVLDNAVALGAPAIRVWAGKRGSADAEAAYRARVAGDVMRIAAQALAAGVVVCYEFHVNTLTDTDESARELLEATRHPAVRTLWQPPVDWPVQKCRESLRGVLPRLQHVHAYHWPRAGERGDLAGGEAEWGEYLRVLADAGRACPVLLEFVKGDDPDQLKRDAATLREWLGRFGTPGTHRVGDARSGV